MGQSEVTPVEMEVTKSAKQESRGFSHERFNESLCRGTHWICKEMKLGKVPIEKVKVLAHHSDISVTDSYRDNNEERDIEELFGFKLS